MSETKLAAPQTSEERAVKLTENARVVLMKRYVRRGPDGKPAESPEDMFRRVARAFNESAPVPIVIRSPSRPTQMGTLWGVPSART